MSSLAGTLGTLLDLALVVFGFGLIVFAHELGHFVAARWAGVRVLAFALGFGPALCSYRKGLGWRRGSSEREYYNHLEAGASATDPAQQGAPRPQISPTEYRINWLPFGGYVKMLGQDDTNPAAVSDAPDSYQNRPIWKRMVVISAGVAVNLVLAFVLFIAVFMAGLRTEPAIVGAVAPGSPAAQATPLADHVGVGLKPGDRILAINGSAPNHFNDVMMKVAVSERGRPVRVDVAREGIGTIEFEAVPEPGVVSGLLDLGFEPPRTLVVDPELANDPTWPEAAEQLGLPGVEAGMRVVRAGDRTDLRRAGELESVFRASAGHAIEVEFASEDGRTMTLTAEPRAELQQGDADPDPQKIAIVQHLLGLRGIVRVSVEESSRGYKQGLRTGDLLTRVGEVEYPSVSSAIREISQNAGRRLPVSVLRADANGSRHEVDLEVEVGSDGRIGIGVTSTERVSALLSEPVARVASLEQGAEAEPTPAAGVFLPGMRVRSIGGREVRDFTDIRSALMGATRDAWEGSATQATVPVVVELAIGRGVTDAPLQTREIDWTLQAADIAALHELSWEAPFPMGVFAPEQFMLRADGPVQAVALGLGETRRMLIRTYLTLARLVQGSVKIEHLQGPVGIAHIGTRIADRGLVWLVFFLALLSVNLAVINFLPLPIVDGGQFLMLVYEQVRGRPVPIPVQGAITMAGLALIGTLFLVVTFNDVSNLLSVIRGP